MADSKPKPSLLKSFLSGGAGGICLVFAGHPLDLIKVRMQTSVENVSAMAIARETVAKEGFKGLYKGMSAPLAGITPIFAVCFWAYGVGQSLVRSTFGLSEDQPLTLMQFGIAGAFSAVPTTAIMAPGERIKCLLQVDHEKRFKGPLDVVKVVSKEEGVASLFRGSAATLARDGTGSFAYFSVYEGIKRGLTPEGSTLSPLAVVMGGGFAGMCNWAVAIPFDTIKSRIQTSPPGTYANMADCFRQLVAAEGPKSLFRGIGPAMVRAFPANAACFMGVELSLKVMNALW